ncbi:metallophosphoesterase family protein, partial [Patescibacteria group bacterium]
MGKKTKFFILIAFFILFFINPKLIYAKDIKFVVAGHIYPGVEYPDVLESFVSQVNETKPDAVFILGDSVKRGTEKEWQILNQYLSQIEVPFFFVPGNHDLHGGSTASKLWMEHVGYLHKSVIIGDYKFILLNSSPNLIKYELSKEEIEFLKKELEDYQNFKQVFLMFHHELWLYPHINWEEKLYPIVKGKVTNVFSGNSGSYFFSKFSYDKNLKYYLIGFPFLEYDRRKSPTYLLVNTKDVETEINLVLVDVPIDSTYYEIKPQEKKDFQETMVDYIKKFQIKINEFG